MVLGDNSGKFAWLCASKKVEYEPGRQSGGRSAMSSYGLHKTTKHVVLVFYMKAGVRISGQFHVPENTSSAVRPSDALHQASGGFINMVNATISSSGGKKHEVPYVSIAKDAIAWVEFPPGSEKWVTPEK
jgi:hypothetical protein